MVFAWLRFILQAAARNQDKPAGLERRLVPQMHGNRDAPTETAFLCFTNSILCARLLMFGVISPIILIFLNNQFHPNLPGSH